MADDTATAINFDVLRNLDTRSLTNYMDLLTSVHKRTLAESATLSVPEMLALTYRITRKSASLMSDKPLKLIDKIARRTTARTQYLNQELGTLKVFKDTLNSIKDNDLTEEIIDIEEDIKVELVKLLYVYEDFLPLQLNLTAYSELLMNRENIIHIIRGEKIRDIHTLGFKFNVDLDLESIIYRIAESSHWPCLVHYLKRGAAKRVKRQRVVLTEIFNAITRLRMYNIEVGHLSHILDQTGYDIEEDDVEHTFKPTNEVKVSNLIDSIINEMGPDVAEHFDNMLDLPMLLVGILEAVKLMGVEDVCLVHHYTDKQ